MLNGIKLFIPDAHVADQLVVVARTYNGSTPDRGINSFLVDRTVEYAQNRIQVGVSFGTFQRAHYHDIDIANDLESPRWTAYEALWELDDGREGGRTPGHLRGPGRGERGPSPMAPRRPTRSTRAQART